MGKFILIGTVLALFGAGCASQTSSNQPSAAQPTEASATVAVPAPTILNAIVVKDQKPGDEAMIDDVSIEAKGYVVVHEDDNGKAGKIVGMSGLLNAGETRSVPVKMKIHAGLSHWAMLHIDNGDGVFDAKQDLPLKDENGEFVMKSFKGEGEGMNANAVERKME